MVNDNPMAQEKFRMLPVRRCVLVLRKHNVEMVQLTLDLPSPFPNDPDLDVVVHFNVAPGTGVEWLKTNLGFAPDEIVDYRDKD